MISIARGFAWRGPFGVPLLPFEEALVKDMRDGREVRVDDMRFAFAGNGWGAVVDGLNRQLAPLGTAVVVNAKRFTLSLRSEAW